MDINWMIEAPFEALPQGDPDRLALAVGAREAVTYRELVDRRDHWISLLVGKGVGHGDRVALLMLNSVDYVAAYFAIARLGAIAVRLNFRLVSAELAFIIDDADCAACVVHTSCLDQVTPIRSSMPVQHWICVPNDDTQPPAWAPAMDGSDTWSAYQGPELARPSGADALMLMYTSGTTGRPKGVIWSHDNTLWLAATQATKWSFDDSTVAMTTGPLYHAGAFEVLLIGALFVQGTAVCLPSGGVTIETILRTIGERRVVAAMLYPFQLYDLLRSGYDDAVVASLRLLLTGGDAVLPWALEAAETALPDARLACGYGLTEATMVTCLDHDGIRAHPDSIGRPMPMARISVGPPGDRAVDDVGEIWIQSPVVTQGYWRRPEATAETYVDGWVRTGDLGRITTDGYLVVTGRAKDMIRSGGENVYPAEVESVLSAHRHVYAIAVVAVPDPRYLEVGCAIVVRATEYADSPTGATEDELRAHASENLAKYKNPRFYVFVDSLPMSAAGKVQKRELRDTYASLGSHPDGRETDLLVSTEETT